MQPSEYIFDDNLNVVNINCYASVYPSMTEENIEMIICTSKKWTLLMYFTTNITKINLLLR